MKARSVHDFAGGEFASESVHVLLFKEARAKPDPAAPPPLLVQTNSTRKAERSRNGRGRADNRWKAATGLAGLHAPSSTQATPSVLGLSQELLEIAKHFDPEYYAHEYPDIAPGRDRLLHHFCEVGWREGRNPNAFFDTVSYLSANADVRRSKINPYFHYLRHGMLEGRIASSSVSPSIRSRLLFGVPILDWVERLRPHVDLDFYLAQLEDLDANGLDLAAHFAYRGWREGISPNPSFDIAAWLRAHPAAEWFAVNPLLAQLEAAAGSFDLHVLTEKRDENPAAAAARKPDDAGGELRDQLMSCDFAEPAGHDAALAVVRPHFDEAYYLAAYPDVRSAGVDALLHFFITGWREGRNPSLQFDTKYYLEMNEDVRDANVNPFWHYFISGRSEGRLPRRPGGYRRQIIDAALEPSKRPVPSPVAGEKVFSGAVLARKLGASIKGKKGLVVAISHDCYIRVIGGTQIFIADEQAKFNALGCAYVHISPQIARLTFAPEDSRTLVRVVADGKLVGLFPIAAVREMLKKIAPPGDRRPTLIVHSMMGFTPADVVKLCAALKPERRLYWLHDYFSLCEGFNLLRNDAHFCGAPPETSFACRVCVYGKTRHAHLQGMRTVFEACRFEVASPSAAALEIWQKSTSLPRHNETVHPHWRLAAESPCKKPGGRVGARKRISIAFVGFAAASKGWHLFCDLVQQLQHDRQYKFYHFAAEGTSSLPQVEFVRTEVTAADRFATRRLLAHHAIDVVAVLSPWPETFSYVAHEAVAAGAKILCLTDSGNVAKLVRSLDYGWVVDDAAAVREFFENHVPASLLKKSAPEAAYGIDQTGTSATFGAPAPLSTRPVA
ncbi:MAG TPA: hypothetical protein VGG11_09535 [Xanthobacteraceae bacterium]